jgi:hypothetical protein
MQFFFLVQKCPQIYSCSSCDVIFLFNVKLACYRPIADLGGGTLPCISLKKAKAMFCKPCYRLEHALLSSIDFCVLEFEIPQLFM